MHERTLAIALLKQIEELLRAHQARRVTEIKVAVGDFSGVEAALLESALAEEARDGSLRGARLCVRRIPLSARCRDCSHEFVIHNHSFRCLACQGENTQVTGGEELLLESVTMEADG